MTFPIVRSRIRTTRPAIVVCAHRNKRSLTTAVESINAARTYNFDVSARCPCMEQPASIASGHTSPDSYAIRLAGTCASRNVTWPNSVRTLLQDVRCKRLLPMMLGSYQTGDGEHVVDADPIGNILAAIRVRSLRAGEGTETRTPTNALTQYSYELPPQKPETSLAPRTDGDFARA
jgi:hypothetical protein